MLFQFALFVAFVAGNDAADDCKESTSGGCFWTEYRTSHITFSEANSICTSHGSVLAVIPDRKTYDEIVEDVRKQLRENNDDGRSSKKILLGMTYDPANKNMYPDGAFNGNWYVNNPNSNPDFTVVSVAVTLNTQTAWQGLLNKAPTELPKYRGAACWKPKIDTTTPLPQTTLRPLEPTTASDVGCYNSSDRGEGYRGSASMTKNGNECEAWTVYDEASQYYPDSGLENNYCRSPLGYLEAPWCFLKDVFHTLEYCDIPICEGIQHKSPPDGCFSNKDKGAGYRGGASVPTTGGKCQNWASQSPHKHDKTPEKFPNAGLENNYCRNPDHSASPWCYTTDPAVRWSYCDIFQCEGCYSNKDKGAGYRGGVSVPKTGGKCQNWTSQSPHKHDKTPEKFPNAGLENNYCRNPDRSASPWCYTTDPAVRWGYCDILQCEGCYFKKDKGAGYRGDASVPKTGGKCQDWTSQSPHKHDKTPEKHPNAGLDNNYCRNPDKSASPWCYTTDPAVRWNYCDIPLCGECYFKKDKGAGYRGGASVPKTGGKCQDWTSQSPHKHDRTPEKYPNAGFESNYCRNPDHSASPWCYTTDPAVRWDYCNILVCEE